MRHKISPVDNRIVRHRTFKKKNPHCESYFYILLRQNFEKYDSYQGLYLHLHAGTEWTQRRQRKRHFKRELSAKRFERTPETLHR